LNILEELKNMMGLAYELTHFQIQNMTFTDLDKFCDATFSRNFEGLPLF